MLFTPSKIYSRLGIKYFNISSDECIKKNPFMHPTQENWTFVFVHNTDAAFQPFRFVYTNICRKFWGHLAPDSCAFIIILIYGIAHSLCQNHSHGASCLQIWAGLDTGLWATSRHVLMGCLLSPSTLGHVPDPEIKWKQHGAEIWQNSHEPAWTE